MATAGAGRIAQLDAAEEGLCFGRLDLVEGERRYVGRIGILDEDGDFEPLLLDWRAPAARPFYVATSAAPQGVRRRRNIRTRFRSVVGIDDDVLDLDITADGDASGLVGEGALLAALTAGRTGRMRDVVETIQAEQDHAIRSELRGVLVVQGGPGTGKTAVALHRAAYLLYTYRERLAKRGVLIVGPNPTFLRYVSHVLAGAGGDQRGAGHGRRDVPGRAGLARRRAGGRRDQGPRGDGGPDRRRGAGPAAGARGRAGSGLRGREVPAGPGDLHGRPGAGPQGEPAAQPGPQGVRRAHHRHAWPGRSWTG